MKGYCILSFLHICKVNIVGLYSMGYGVLYPTDVGGVQYIQ